MKKKLFLVVGLAAVGAAILFGRHYCTAHTVDPEVLGRIKPGMEWEVARKLIPTDHQPRPVGNGERMVGLRKHDRWCMVDVFVDADGKVISVFHDH